MMKVMITGAGGYVARNLIRELERNGHELRLVDRVAPDQATMFNPGTGGRDEVPFSSPWPFAVAEITDENAMLRACEGMDAVIHLAAALKGSPEIGIQTMQTNVVGTYTVIDAARRSGVKRFLCASSINAFGTFYWRISQRPVPYTSMPLTEDFAPIYEDPYSLSKFCAEETCAAFHRAYGITTAAFRFAGVWNQALYQEFRAKPLPPTTEWSDLLYQWVHVEDLVAGLRQALERADLPGYGVYSLGSGDTRAPESTMDLLERFRPDLAKTVTRPLPGRAPLLSIDKARATFGYAPRFRLAD
jgi:nucleoside-diphosphate-sugar epimerase